MSDSDSDLEFESADEETEQDFSEAIKSGSQGNESSENCREVSAFPVGFETSAVTIPEKDAQLPQQISLVPHEVQNEHYSNVQELDVEAVSAADSQTETSNLVSATNADRERASDKQRVTLRLEKKLQKKNVPPPEEPVEKDSLTTPVPPCSKLGEKVAESSWSLGWGTGFLSNAVSTLTTQVSQGIGAVVENSLGVPSPEELARSTSGPEDACAESPVTNKEDSQTSLLDMSAWTRVLEDTGSRVLSGGLDTLELIGKKTMDLLTEGDPGLRNKRAVLAQQGGTLSQLLREAQARDSVSLEVPSFPPYNQLLDDLQGLAHLEALEMISRQSEAMLARLSADSPQSSELAEICKEVSEDEEHEKWDDLRTLLQRPLFQLSLDFNGDALVQIHRKMQDPKQFDRDLLADKTPQDVFQSCVCCLAEFTSRCMEAFHRLAERVMAGTGRKLDISTTATQLRGLAAAMCVEVDKLATRYQECLESLFAAVEGTNITVIVTNLYVEAENSNRYIRDSFRLLVPVLQVALLRDESPS